MKAPTKTLRISEKKMERKQQQQQQQQQQIPGFPGMGSLFHLSASHQKKQPSQGLPKY